MSLRLRSIVLLVLSIAFLLAACGQSGATATPASAAVAATPTQQEQPTPAPSSTESPPTPAQPAESTTVAQGSSTTGVDVHVKQDPGKVVYWILPGQRRLGEIEWGTPAHPRALLEPVMEKAKQLPAPLNHSVPQLLQQIPILGGLPLAARETNEDGTKFTTTKKPTAVGDQGRIVSGSFDVVYQDRQPYDLPGSLLDTQDAVQASAHFTDPAGNEYELVVEKLWQPPIPDWETGGGVLTNAFIHGNTGTESPLFPRVFSWGAFWGLGKVIVNGKVVNEDQWIHFMTTQTVRDKDYRLVTQDELPLSPDDTIAGQVHHTHVIVRPVKVTPDGPVFEPVHTAFELPNGQMQPFLHIMFEQDEIVQSPFADWTPAPPAESTASTAENADAITVEGSEFSFSPDEITVKKGQEVTIVFKNVGTLAHNYTIGDLGVKSETIRPGQTATVTFTPTQTGTFAFWCDVPGHRQAGMEGTLHVES